MSHYSIIALRMDDGACVHVCVRVMSALQKNGQYFSVTLFVAEQWLITTTVEAMPGKGNPGRSVDIIILIF